MLAITLDNWDEVNSYFGQGWEYVDSKIIEKKKGKIDYYFILGKISRYLLRLIGRDRNWTRNVL